MPFYLYEILVQFLLPRVFELFQTLRNFNYVSPSYHNSGVYGVNENRTFLIHKQYDEMLIVFSMVMFYIFNWLSRGVFIFIFIFLLCNVLSIIKTHININNFVWNFNSLFDIYVYTHIRIFVSIKKQMFKSKQYLFF